ncbi:MAG: hypothetical protein N2Z58_06120 [Fervidobacterium sp.]|nr:hypothetical protein [Fervidobacterium sp.]
MRLPNFTVWFIIAVFFVGWLAIFIYEHFRFSPFALQVDFEVVKEYLFDRHVDLFNPILRNQFRVQQIQFDQRLTAYGFALKISDVLAFLNDGTTRIEVPLRRIDKVLPLRFKYISGEVVVVESVCDVPEGSVLLSINGIPIEQVLKKYSKFYPNLDEFESKYSFVDKQLQYYLKIIDASSVQITYRLPETNTQRIAYLKGVESFPTKKSVIDVYKSQDTIFVKINTFKVSSKEDMAQISQQFERIAQESTETSKIIFDLRYASDGDDTIPSIILSYLVDQPVDLYPSLYVRYKNKLIKKQQIPITPSQNKIKGLVYFLVDNSCFYKPHKTILAFVSEYSLGKIICSSHQYTIPKEFYVDEFWKVLPNTKSYIVFPTGKVVLEKKPTVFLHNEIDLTYRELINKNTYTKYLEKIKIPRNFDLYN